MIDEQVRKDLIARFDRLAPERDEWVRKNAYYYEDQKRFFRFVVPRSRSVLELGCGTGDLLKALEPRRGLGVDISPEMIRKASEKYPDLEFRVGDMEQLDAWGETFDVLVLADVVGLLQDVEETFRRLRPFCRPETRVIISYYNFLWEPVLSAGERMGLKMPQKHQNWLSAEDIGNLLSLTGYEVVKSESRLLLPKGIPGLSRFVNRYLASLPGLRRLSLCRYIVARPIRMRPKRAYSTTILIPCRNERGNIEQAVERIPPFGGPQEILFVEGGSSDGTQEEIDRVIVSHPEKSIRLAVQDGKGKGDAVRKGFSLATGEILMILDADLTVPPEDLPKFYRALAEDHGEFINGCRLVYPMERQAMRFLNLLGNKFFSLMFTWILNQRLKDTLCGTKALLREDYEKIRADRGYFGDFDPFGDFDLIFGAAKQNLKIVEVPIRYRERTYGSTNISRFRHGWLLLRMTLFAYRKIKAI